MDARRDASNDGVAVNSDAALEALLAAAADGAATTTAQTAREALSAACEALCSAGAPDALARARGPVDAAAVAFMLRHAGTVDVQALGCNLLHRLATLGVTNWCAGAARAAAAALRCSRCHVDALEALRVIMRSSAQRADADAHACAMDAVTAALQLSDDALRESETDAVLFRRVCCDFIVLLMRAPVAPNVMDSAACDTEVVPAVVATLRDGRVAKEALEALFFITSHSAQRAQAAVHACALEVVAALLRKLTWRGAGDPREALESNSDAASRQGCCACIDSIVRSCVGWPPLVRHANDVRADEAVIDTLHAHPNDAHLAFYSCTALKALYDADILRQGSAEVARVALLVLQRHGESDSNAAHKACVLLCALLCRNADEGGNRHAAGACVAAGGTRAVLRAARAHAANARMQQACCGALSLLAACGCTTEAERADAADVALDALAAHAADKDACESAVSALVRIWENADASGDALASGPRRADAAMAVVSVLRRHGTSATIASHAGSAIVRLTQEPAAQAAAADADAAAVLLTALRVHGVACSTTAASCCTAVAQFIFSHAASSAASAVDAFEIVFGATRAHGSVENIQVGGCMALAFICDASPHAALGDAALNDALRWALHVLTEHPTHQFGAVAVLRLLVAVVRKLTARGSPLATAGSAGVSAEAEVAAVAAAAAARHSSFMDVQRNVCLVLCALSGEHTLHDGKTAGHTPPGVLPLLASALLRHGIARDDDSFVVDVLTCLWQRLPNSRHPDGTRLWDEALECGLCEAVLTALCAGASGAGFAGSASSAWHRDDTRCEALPLLFRFLKAAPPAVARRVRACGAPALLRELLSQACTAHFDETTRAVALQAASQPTEEADAATSVPAEEWEAYSMSGACCGYAGCGAEQCHDGRPLKRCGGCKAAAYCGAEHQHNAWRTHKRICGVRAAVDAARR